jgi:hypothetical protein
MSCQTKLPRARRLAPQQINLFAGGPRATGIPAWSGLPTQTQAALIALMTQLMLDHADKNRLGSTGAGHDF